MSTANELLDTFLHAHDQATDEQRSTDAIRAGLAATLRELADHIDRGPAIPLPPSIYSALLREHADGVATDPEGQQP
jgi:hypothetical protein